MNPPTSRLGHDPEMSWGSMSTTLALCMLLGAADAQRPKLSSGAAGSKGSSQDESLGSQLLSTVISNDVKQAETIFASVTAAQSMRLANAIDWRGKSVLMHAASRDHANMVDLLVKNKARIEATDYTGGMTALMLAARNGSLAAVETLVTAGANVNAATPHGTTTLMNAVANGSLPVIGQLIKSGADVNAKDKTGATALSLAANTGVVDVIRMLLLAEADIEAADLQGATPLLVAAAAGQLQRAESVPSALPDDSAPSARLRCLVGPRPLPRSPERRLSSWEARRGRSSPPPAVPSLRTLRLHPPGSSTRSRCYSSSRRTRTPRTTRGWCR